jgi:signal transduction histidine kinase
VQDTGTGIPASKLDKVFEAFWTTKQKGLGMGLSVCRAIVESYGGRIWCESSAAGNVTFRLKLPLAADEVTGPSEAATARARSDGRARM